MSASYLKTCSSDKTKHHKTASTYLQTCCIQLHWVFKTLLNALHIHMQSLGVEF